MFKRGLLSLGFSRDFLDNANPLPTPLKIRPVGELADETPMSGAGSVLHWIAENSFVGTFMSRKALQVLITQLRKSRMKEKMTAHLVTISVEDLGFIQPADLQSIYTTAKRRGMLLLPLDAVLQLRKAYQSQPEDELLFMGTEGNAEEGKTFALRGRDGYGMLTVELHEGDAGTFGLDTVFVFRYSDEAVQILDIS